MIAYTSNIFDSIFHHFQNLLFIPVGKFIEIFSTQYSSNFLNSVESIFTFVEM